jgi:regulatory protein
LADADGADGSARAAADTPPTWAELVAAEQAAEAAAGADAETSPSSAELVAAEKTGAEAGPVRDWSKPKPESTRASGSGSGKKRSGFGESGGSGFGSLSGAKKTAKKPSSAGGQRSDSRQRSHFRDRASSESEPAAKKPQSREKLEQRAKNILLYHLGRSMRTRSQLAELLKKKDIPDDVAEAVLDRFEDLHLLDDAQYAETFVRSRHEERGLAKRALGYELRKRGIDNEVAEEALATLDEDQEAARARRLVDTRLRSTAGLDPQVRIRRLVGMLARKGYSSSVAMRVIRDAIAEEGERLDAELAESLEDPGFD